jgi:hypothetical protein
MRNCTDSENNFQRKVFETVADPDRESGKRRIVKVHRFVTRHVTL